MPSPLLSTGIALGSNLGNRKETILKALKVILSWHESTPDKILLSSLYETAPYQCSDKSKKFLNCVIQIDTSVFYSKIIKNILGLEVSLGRPGRHGYHTPRVVDIDLLYQENQSTCSSFLELPHPRIRERLFVLEPLNEIAPDLQLPGWQYSTQEALQQLKKTFSVPELEEGIKLDSSLSIEDLL